MVRGLALRHSAKTLFFVVTLALLAQSLQGWENQKDSNANYSGLQPVALRNGIINIEFLTF